MALFVNCWRITHSETMLHGHFAGFRLRNAHPRRKPAELRDCKGMATFYSESDRHTIDHGNVIGGNWWPIGQTCTILLPISDRGTARGGAIEGIHSYETGFSSQHFCFLGGLARSETLRFWQSGMTAAGTGSLVAEQCLPPQTARTVRCLAPAGRGMFI